MSEIEPEIRWNLRWFIRNIKSNISRRSNCPKSKETWVKISRNSKNFRKFWKFSTSIWMLLGCLRWKWLFFFLNIYRSYLSKMNTSRILKHLEHHFVFHQSKFFDDWVINHQIHFKNNCSLATWNKLHLIITCAPKTCQKLRSIGNRTHDL